MQLVGHKQPIQRAQLRLEHAMPKVRKRKTAGGALDPFAPAPADGTEGAMMRFHRLQQRELRKKIQDLEMER